MAFTKPAMSKPMPGARRAFQRAITGWFSQHAEDHPWRRTRDPYAVLVSELMLQQTQVATVLGRRYFERWLERFPDVATLAAAEEAAVLKAWEGLGYYRRARNLQMAARRVVEHHSGRFPETVEEIQALPGVGRYTAGAVASFAFGCRAPVVDANVARVLARLFDFGEEVDTPAGQRQLWQWAAQLLPAKGAREYNSGLMELGQKVCKARLPACDDCPVARFCATRAPELLPVKKSRKRTVFLDEHVILAIDADGRVLLEQETGRRREGLWKLPAAAAPPRGPILLKAPYSITHHRVQLIVHEGDTGSLAAPQAARGFTAAEIQGIAMPSPYRRALDSLMARRSTCALE